MFINRTHKSKLEQCYYIFKVFFDICLLQLFVHQQKFQTATCLLYTNFTFILSQSAFHEINFFIKKILSGVIFIRIYIRLVFIDFFLNSQNISITTFENFCITLLHHTSDIGRVKNMKIILNAPCFFYNQINYVDFLDSWL